MKKLLFLTIVAFSFVNEADARFIFNRNKDASASRPEPVETVKKVEPVRNISKEPEKRSFFGRQDSQNDTGSLDEGRVISPKSFSKEDNMMVSVTGAGGSPALLKTTKEGMSKYKSSVDDKPLSNSIEDLKQRRAKNRERFQENTGLSLEESDAFYSQSINMTPNKKMELVSDPLDKD